MKKPVVILIQCILMLGVSNADNSSFLNLKSNDEQTVCAKILSYDQSTDMVSIERDNRKRYTVKTDVFCKSDQNIIRNWDRLSGFFNKPGLAVSVERISDKEDGKQQSKRNSDNEEEIRWMSVAHYRVSMENCTTQPLNNITLEIIPFLKWEVFRPERDIDFSVKSGKPMQTFDISTIGQKTHQSCETRRWGYESMTIEKNSDFITKDIIEFRGVWVRVYAKLPNGTKIIVRDIKEPEGLWAGIEWSDATKAIDLNTYQIIDETSLIPDN